MTQLAWLSLICMASALVSAACLGAAIQSGSSVFWLAAAGLTTGAWSLLAASAFYRFGKTVAFRETVAAQSTPAGDMPT